MSWANLKHLAGSWCEENQPQYSSAVKEGSLKLLLLICTNMTTCVWCFKESLVRGYIRYWYLNYEKILYSIICNMNYTLSCITENTTWQKTKTMQLWQSATKLAERQCFGFWVFFFGGDFFLFVWVWFFKRKNNQCKYQGSWQKG